MLSVNIIIIINSATVIRSMVEESAIDFEGFDLDVVSRYLGEYLTEKEIRD